VLLSLLPPSLMVVPERQLVNTHLDSLLASVNNFNHTIIIWPGWPSDIDRWCVMNAPDAIEEFYDMYLDEERTPHIVEREDDRLGLVLWTAFWLSPFSIFFSFLFYFSILSVGKHVTLCDRRSDKVTSHVISHIVWLGVWERRCTDQQKYV